MWIQGVFFEENSIRELIIGWFIVQEANECTHEKYIKEEISAWMCNVSKENVFYC
jgi:hypothetical protein